MPTKTGAPFTTKTFGRQPLSLMAHEERTNLEIEVYSMRLRDKK